MRLLEMPYVYMYTLILKRVVLYNLPIILQTDRPTGLQSLPSFRTSTATRNASLVIDHQNDLMSHVSKIPEILRLEI